MLWLAGALGWLRKAFSAILGLVTRWPWQAALVASACLSAWLLLVTVPGLKSDNRALATRIIQQKAEFEDARVKAAKAALAAKNAAEIHYRSIAERADNEAETAIADARARADAYARRMRVQGIGCASSRPTSPAEGSGPQSPDRSGEDAGLVALTRDDFDALVENTIRLNEAQKWALSLSLDPIPAPEF